MIGNPIFLKLSIEEEKFYQIAWDLIPKNGATVSGDDFREFIKGTPIPPKILFMLWNKSDTDKDGRINRQEFIAFLKSLAKFQHSPNLIDTYNPYTSNDHILPNIAIMRDHMTKVSSKSNNVAKKQDPFAAFDSLSNTPFVFQGGNQSISSDSNSAMPVLSKTNQISGNKPPLIQQDNKNTEKMNIQGTGLFNQLELNPTPSGPNIQLMGSKDSNTKLGNNGFQQTPSKNFEITNVTSNSQQVVQTNQQKVEQEQINNKPKPFLPPMELPKPKKNVLDDLLNELELDKKQGNNVNNQTQQPMQLDVVSGMPLQIQLNQNNNDKVNIIDTTQNKKVELEQKENLNSIQPVFGPSKQNSIEKGQQLQSQPKGQLDVQIIDNFKATNELINKTIKEVDDWNLTGNGTAQDNKMQINKAVTTTVNRMNTIISGMSMDTSSNESTLRDMSDTVKANREEMNQTVISICKSLEILCNKVLAKKLGSSTSDLVFSNLNNQFSNEDPIFITNSIQPLQSTLNNISERCTNSINMLQAEINEMNSKSTQLKDEMNRVLEVIPEYVEKIKDLEMRRAQAKARNDTLASNINIFEDMASELGEKITSLEAEIERLESRTPQLQQKWNETYNNTNNLIGKIGNVQNQIEMVRMGVNNENVQITQSPQKQQIQIEGKISPGYSNKMNESSPGKKSKAETEEKEKKGKKHKGKKDSKQKKNESKSNKDKKDKKKSEKSRTEESKDTSKKREFSQSQDKKEEQKPSTDFFGNSNNFDFNAEAYDSEFIDFASLNMKGENIQNNNNNNNNQEQQSLNESNNPENLKTNQVAPKKPEMNNENISNFGVDPTFNPFEEDDDNAGVQNTETNNNMKPHTFSGTDFDSFNGANGNGKYNNVVNDADDIDKVFEGFDVGIHDNYTEEYTLPKAGTTAVTENKALGVQKNSIGDYGGFKDPFEDSDAFDHFGKVPSANDFGSFGGRLTANNKNFDSTPTAAGTDQNKNTFESGGFGGWGDGMDSSFDEFNKF